MNDHTYFDTVKSFGFSQRLADDLLASSSNFLESKIDTSGPGAPVVVFNPNGWKRNDAVEVQVGFADRDVHAVSVVDSSGKTVPSQLTFVEKYDDGSLMNVKVAFVATDVPACGYATYHVVPAESSVDADVSPNDLLENEFYRVKVDLKSGAILSIWDKSLNAELLSAPANVVARQADRGDLWELYHTLDGTQFLPEMDPQPVPTGTAATLSTAFGDKPGGIRRGPAFSEFSVSHPFGSGSYATRVRLTQGVKRIDIETDLVNQDKFVRYQVLFPTSIERGNNVQGVAYGAIERPKSVEFPAQDWVDTSDGRQGVALLNLAMPGNVLTDRTLMLSLLRSVTEGGYNGGDSSATGLELGVKRTFRYALVPHGGDWRSAQIPCAAQDFTRPLVAFKSEPHSGSLPKRWSAIEISDPDCILTSVQPGPGGAVVLRVYEATGKPLHGVRIKLGPKLRSAESSNLMGDSKGKLPTADNSVVIDLHPFEIKTIKVGMTFTRRA
jgi:alpha-mannosidase